MKNAMRIGGLVTALAVFSGVATAAPILFNSTGGTTEHSLGSFAGQISYDGAGDTGLLTVTITHTDLFGAGGYLTALALNAPSGVTVTGVTSTLSSMNNFLSGGVNAAPLGSFDFGVSVGNNWEGGGPASNGIAAGGTATFVFTLGGDLTGITEQSFVDEGSTIGYWLGVRFRAFANGGSDKVTPGLIPSDPPPNEIPEPTTMALLGGALVGLALFRRRRQ